jgi:hypothetical protein
MKSFVFIILLLGLGIPGRIYGQNFAAAGASALADRDAVMVTFEPAGTKRPELPLRPADNLSVLSAEDALSTYEIRAAAQSSQLASYSAVSVIRAELPDTDLHGEFEVERKYSAPRTLLFKPIRFVGDKFVKSNIITRILQSEVDHVQKDDATLTAVNSSNYKFSYKGHADLDGRDVLQYAVKPRAKRPGLFKGKLYLDAHNGGLVRVEGNIVKSPSFFVKHVQFVQDYAEIDNFMLPVHNHTEAQARIVGRTIVDITYTDYHPVPATVQAVIPTM